MNQGASAEDWNILAEFDLQNEPEWEQKVTDHLTRAVSRYRPPAAFLSRLKAGVKKAVSKIFQDSYGAGAQQMLTVRLIFKSAQPPVEAYRGWGFFMVSNRGDEVGRSNVGIFLYQEDL